MPRAVFENKGLGVPLGHDKLVLTLLWHETRNTVRSLRAYDKIFFLIAGSLLLTYYLGNFLIALRANAAEISGANWIWGVISAVLIILGFGAGIVTSGISSSRAYAPFLLTLPLSANVRRRMVVTATFYIGFALALFAGFALALICDVIHRPYAVVWGAMGTTLFFIGVIFGLLTKNFFTHSEKSVLSDADKTRTFWIPGIVSLDSAKPTWLGSWACGLPAGRLRIRVFLVIIITALSLTVILSGGASLAQHDAIPAAVDAVIGGLIVFMLSVRCKPLGSAVLRTAPLGFTRSWFGVLRLPLALSAAFFVMPAGVAFAAEPTSWGTLVGGGFSLLLLDGAYAVFAAYFMMSPLSAAVSFVGAVSYAAYEWFKYHDIVYMCLAVLLVWLWWQTRWRFLHGSG